MLQRGAKENVPSMIQVFYSVNTRDTAMFGMVKHSSSKVLKIVVAAAVRDAANYEHVATFADDARDLDDVWEAMQSDCSAIPRTLRKRSMMVGDVLVTDAREVFVVDSCGFERIDDVDAVAFLARVTQGTVFSAPKAVAS